MRNIIRTIQGVMGKVGLSILGLFVFFDVMLLLNWAVKGFGPIRIENLWDAPKFFLTFPFTDAAFNIAMLWPLLYLVLLPGETLQELAATVDLHAYFFSFFTLLLRDFALLFLVVFVVIVFEKQKRKSLREIIAFYFIVPPLLWILVPRLFSFFS